MPELTLECMLWGGYALMAGYFWRVIEEALTDASTRENMTEACNRLRIPPPSKL